MAQNYAGAIYLPISFAANQLSRAKPVIYQHSYNPKNPDGRSAPGLRPHLHLVPPPEPERHAAVDPLQHEPAVRPHGGVLRVAPPRRTAGLGDSPSMGSRVRCKRDPQCMGERSPLLPVVGGRWYQVTPYVSQYPGGTASAFIPAEQMVRLYAPHPLFDKVAYSVLQAISQSVDTVRAIDQARASVQELGCQHGLVIELDPQLQNPGTVDMKRVRDTFNQIYGGARKAGSSIIMPPGAKLAETKTTPDDMAWQEGWNPTDGLRARLLPDQPGRYRHERRPQLRHAVRLDQAGYWTKLEPRLEAFAQGFNKDYFDPYLGEDYFCEFELPRMDDEQQKIAGLKLDLDAGVLTKGQYLRERGYEVDPETTPGLDELIGGKPHRPHSRSRMRKRTGPATSRARARWAAGYTRELLTSSRRN